MSLLKKHQWYNKIISDTTKLISLIQNSSMIQGELKQTCWFEPVTSPYDIGHSDSCNFKDI